jgi:predicted transcriptional regulator
MRRARHERGWSQRDLQRISGVHQTVISRMERGLRPGLRLDAFAEILDALEPQVVVDAPDPRSRYGPASWFEER